MKAYVNALAEFQEELKVKPVNTSGRSKAQIVAEAEATWMLSNLVGLETHDENCRCFTCFHKGLDRIIHNSEQALKEAEEKYEAAL